MSYKPDIAIPPGETLKETIDYMNMSQAELSLRTGITPKTINRIIKGKNPITPSTAIKLERVLGVKDSFWNNLEKNYQEALARIKAEKEKMKEIKYAKKYTCYSQLTQQGFVDNTRSWPKKVENLLNFFNVSSLRYALLKDQVAYRKSDGDISIENLSAWLRCGELIAENMEVKRFTKDKIERRIETFRHLTNSKNFSRKLVELSAECGIAVVYLQHFKSTRINGATRWIKGKPIIQLSVRFKYADIFWFTFFHELGHLLLHERNKDFLNFEIKTRRTEQEKEADNFASDKLIPNKQFKNFVKGRLFTRTAIVKFADRIKIDPSIVAGRLGHEKIVPWSYVESLRYKLGIQ